MLDATGWGAVAAGVAALVSIGAALYARSQARTAKKALKVADKAAIAAQNQADSASESASAACVQNDLVREQIDLMRAQLDAEQRLQDERDGPDFDVQVSPGRYSSEVQPADNPAGESVVRVNVRPVQITRIGGPDEIELRVVIAGVNREAPLRLNGGDGATHRMVTGATAEVEIIVPVDWTEADLDVELDLTATEVAGRQRPWHRKHSVAFRPHARRIRGF